MALTRDERSLLLFLETQAVDHGGRVAGVHMSADDFNIAKRWNQEEYIKFGRIMSADIIQSSDAKRGHWCELSEKAFGDAHKERIARSIRMLEARNYRKTKGGE